jgi:hypothetical protein
VGRLHSWVELLTGPTKKIWLRVLDGPER